MFERFSDRARRVIGLAHQESRRLNREYVGTEHILLGLIQEGAGVASHVLRNLEVDLHQVRREVEKIVEIGGAPLDHSATKDFTLANKVLSLSDEESKRLGSGYIGTEHLLLGLTLENDGVAAQVLKSLGIKAEDIRLEVHELLGVDLDLRDDQEKKEDDSAATSPIADVQAAAIDLSLLVEAQNDLETDRLIAAIAELNTFKDESLARRLHELAGEYQKRPQDGWTAPPDWQCWKDSQKEIVVVRPIKPSEVVKKVPPEIIEIFNDLIQERWDGRKSVIRQKEVVPRICEKLKIQSAQVFEKGWLDVESLFRKEGWHVKYEKPAIDENFDAYYEFAKS